jgi:hypothetical protein
MGKSCFCTACSILLLTLNHQSGKLVSQLHRGMPPLAVQLLCHLVLLLQLCHELQGEQL